MKSNVSLESDKNLFLYPIFKTDITINMKNAIKIFSIALFAIVSTGLSAQKFGYLNSQALIQGIPEVKEAEANLETFQQQLAKQGQDMLAKLQTNYQELEKKQAQGEISPKQLEAEAAKLKEEESKLMAFEQNSQQKIMEKSESLLKPIRDKIQAAIDEVASENSYTYIFDASTGFVLYADESTDVSDLVKAKLGL